MDINNMYFIALLEGYFLAIEHDILLKCHHGRQPAKWLYYLYV